MAPAHRLWDFVLQPKLIHTVGLRDGAAGRSESGGSLSIWSQDSGDPNNPGVCVCVCACTCMCTCVPCMGALCTPPCVYTTTQLPFPIKDSVHHYPFYLLPLRTQPVLSVLNHEPNL